MHHRILITVASLLLIAASEPPQDVPVPMPKPDQHEDAKPEKKPEEKLTPAPAEATVPKPEEKPATPPAADERKKDIEKKAEEPAPEPVKEENPEELKACLSDLKQLGAEFTEIAPIKGEENGCGIASPIEISTIVPGIKLEPKGTVRCETALALARWTKDIIVPTAKIAMPDRNVIALNNASTYICRNRNSAETGKISEHAKGSAVDIATLTFEKGEPLVMKPRDEDGTMEGAFQRTITTAACLFFRTVLSPGSDATHQDHLHLDVLERKGGYLYCR